MSEPKQIIHIRIRDLRRERALTQEELAAALGISRQSVNAMEAGRCLPSLPIALQIASYFSVPLTDVFGMPDGRPAEAASSLVPWMPLRDVREVLGELSSRRDSRVPMAAANIRQDERTVAVEFYVPGYSRDRLDIEVGEEFVKLIGEAAYEEYSYLYREVGTADFQRTVPLPVAVRPSEADAELREGVLTVTVPKAVPEAPRSAKVVIRAAD